MILCIQVSFLSQSSIGRHHFSYKHPRNESRHSKTMWFLNGSDTSRSALSQKMARSLKFWISKEELYYPCSENKGADQLCGYSETDQRLCFCIGRLMVFS